MKKPRSSEAYEGDTVIIVCEVVGDPKPEIIWLRDFLKVSINGALLFSTRTFPSHKSRDGRKQSTISKSTHLVISTTFVVVRVKKNYVETVATLI